MNSYLIYCNRCYQTSLLTGNQTIYLVTSCGKIICQNCSTLLANQLCPGCKQANCSKKVISNQLDPDVKSFFQSTQGQLSNLQKVQRYQKIRLKNYERFLLEKNARSDAKLQEIQQRFQEIEQSNNEKMLKIAQLQQVLKQQHQPNHYLHQQPAITNTRQVPEKESIDASFAKKFKAGIAGQSNLQMPKLKIPPKSLASSRITSVNKKMNIFNGSQFTQQNDYKTPVMNSKKKPATQSSISKISKISKNAQVQNKPPPIQTTMYNIFNSTPIVGHENKIKDFALGNRPPSSIISSSSLLFREKRQYIKQNF